MICYSFKARRDDGSFFVTLITSSRSRHTNYANTDRKGGNDVAKGDRLTEKQETFVQALVAGYSRQKAYKMAYPKAENWTLAAVEAEAYKTWKKPLVQKRYEELYSEYTEHVKTECHYTRDQLLNDFIYLKDKAKESIETVGVRQANSTAYINALRNIGEILDLYPDKKVDVKANVCSNDFEVNITNDSDDNKDKK